jgi:hypothetical protein
MMNSLFAVHMKGRSFSVWTDCRTALHGTQGGIAVTVVKARIRQIVSQRQGSRLQLTNIGK